MELEQGRVVEYPWATSLRRAGPVNWLLRPVVSYHRLSDLRALDRFIQVQALAPYRREAAQAPPFAPSLEERREFREFQESRSPVLKVLRMTFVLASLRWNEIEAAGSSIAC